MAELLTGTMAGSLSDTVDSQQSLNISGGIEITDLTLQYKLARETILSWQKLSLDRFESNQR
jgi:hypothetical protein